jgi:dihydrofolate synthase/folylpolyglutamate synthase
LAVIEAEAAAQGAKLWRRGVEWKIEGYGYGTVYDKMALPRPSLLGAHQVENAGIAITSLRAAGYNFSDKILAKGLTTAEWPARMQRLHGALAKALPAGSTLWLDGAHNPGGAEAVATQLAAFSGPTTLVIGMKQSKDVAEVLRILLPHAAQIFAVAEPEQHLALPVEKIIEASGGKALPGPDLRSALAQITAPTRVVICGSLYLAGEALKLDEV